MEKALLPRVLRRADHPISRTMISPNALKILYRLKDRGHIAYLVGGCVRDLLLGREPKDFDVATDATPNEVKQMFRNCRLVGRRFRLAHLHFRDEIIEVATFRAIAQEALPEGPDADGVETLRNHPLHLVSEEGVVLRDNVFGTPAEDVVRRDFTVNALAYDISDFSIRDYVGGVEDLGKGLIRTIGDPRVSFTEDPVRMLRAVRFAALLGFAIEDETWEALVENASNITRATAPRLYEEILKLFLSGEGERTYQLMRKSGLFSALFPGFAAWLDEESEGFPHVRLGADLEWVDRMTGKGEKISPSLLLALMFSEYLDEGAHSCRVMGMAPQEAMNTAVAGFLSTQAPLVAIPHRVGVGVRDILVLQHRLRRIPGKRPQSVLARTCFADALTYLRCRCEISGEGIKVFSWWDRYAREHILPQLEPAEEASVARPRRRRRRRRSRAAQATPE